MFHLLITRCLKVKISLPLRLALGAFESNFEPGDRTLKKAILKKVKSSGGFPVGGGKEGKESWSFKWIDTSLFIVVCPQFMNLKPIMAPTISVISLLLKGPVQTFWHSASRLSNKLASWGEMGLVMLKDSSTSGLPTYMFRYFRYHTGSASVVIFSFALTIFFIWKVGQYKHQNTTSPVLSPSIQLKNKSSLNSDDEFT